MEEHEGKSISATADKLSERFGVSVDSLLEAGMTVEDGSLRGSAEYTSSSGNARYIVTTEILFDGRRPGYILIWRSVEKLTKKVTRKVNLIETLRGRVDKFTWEQDFSYQTPTIEVHIQPEGFDPKDQFKLSDADIRAHRLYSGQVIKPHLNVANNNAFQLENMTLIPDKNYGYVYVGGNSMGRRGKIEDITFTLPCLGEHTNLSFIEFCKEAENPIETTWLDVFRQFLAGEIPGALMNSLMKGNPHHVVCRRIDFNATVKAWLELILEEAKTGKTTGKHGIDFERMFVYKDPPLTRAQE